MGRRVRSADLAGTWYPATARECRSAFREFERGCSERRTVPQPRGGLVPHAGWVFSGRLAYNTIRELGRGAAPVDTVLIFGGHLHPSSPITVLGSGEYWTPLGTVPVDEELAAALLREGGVEEEDPERHAPDNTIELQMPMVKHFFPEARLISVAAPPRPETLLVCEKLLELASALGRRVVAIGSTDLTHYGPNYGFSPKGRGAQAETWVREENDRRFIDLALVLSPAAMVAEALQHQNACCPGAAAAAVRCGQLLGAGRGELLGYATSADVRPDESFVGYASIIF